MRDELKRKYANLVIEVGVNIQEDQELVIASPVENYEFARMLTEEAYKKGAKRVLFHWYDDYINKQNLENISLENLKDIPGHYKQLVADTVKNKRAMLTIMSQVPEINKDCNEQKLNTLSIAQKQVQMPLMKHMGSGESQWCIIGVPNQGWANYLFPNFSNDEALDKLWEYILQTSRVDTNTNPVDNWNKHNSHLAKNRDLLNEHQFDSLHFKNDLGTDLTIKLVTNHIWVGGNFSNKYGTLFNPNIPTEEIFSMPNKYGTNGKVVATKPININGKTIENFWFEFKDGRVIDFGAEKNEDVLANTLKTDDNAPFLGEVALVGYNTPINKQNLFYCNILYDENASCHLALGRAIPMSIKEGFSIDPTKYDELGINYSMIHQDFMFGSKDLTIIGKKKDGTKTHIFQDGEFVL